jgi:transposase
LIGGVSGLEKVPMTVAITRKELGASELRREAVRCPEANAARRMLALALVLEGRSREAAARAAGMDRQTLRDWVHRYNAEGLAGLHDRPRSGRKPRLTPEQMAELEKVVEQGPDPARDGVVRWRRVDLKALIKARFDVDLHERSVGKVLHRLGFARLSVRPKHPSSQPEAQETFKKLRSIGSGGAARARGRQAARDLVPRRGPCRPAGHLDPGLGAPRHPPAGTA